MKVTRKAVDGVGILRLEGEFDSFETEMVREGFEACVGSEPPRVVLDLQELTFANSTTIAYFITAQKRAQALGGSVVLAAPGDFLKKTLKTLGLDQVFVFSGSVDEAVARLKSS
jgi:anti-anti-sigma factor